MSGGQLLCGICCRAGRLNVCPAAPAWRVMRRREGSAESSFDIALDFDRCRSAATHFVVCLPSPITVHERTLNTVSICIVNMGTSPAASELLLTSEQRYALQSHLPSKVVHIR